MKDFFIFCPTLNLLEFILEKNYRQIRIFRIFVIEYILGRTENFHKIFFYLMQLNTEICKTYKLSKNPLKNLEGISLNLKVDLKNKMNFIDMIPENFEENPLLTTPSPKTFLHLFMDSEYFFKEIKNPSKKNELEITVYNLMILICEALISNWDVVCYILLIFYHFYTKAICSFFIIFYLFAFVCVEEHHNMITTWKPMFIYIYVIAMIKMMMFLQMIKPFTDEEMINDNTFPYKNDYIPIFQVKIRKYF